MSKPKIAFHRCVSCGGCEMALLDLFEDRPDWLEAMDIVRWPVTAVSTIDGVEELPDRGIAVSFINGAIRTEAQAQMAQLLRRKSDLVVALGACAVSGGIPALANLTPREESPAPGVYARVHKLDDVIGVDYYLPGCAPPVPLVAGAVQAILDGELPERGAVLAPNKALCASCPLNGSKPDDVRVEKLRRPVEVALDPRRCFLLQGVLCMGPATRDGCGVACVEGNMPCTGCLGPTDNAGDQGAAMLGALGGIVDGDTPEEFGENTRALVDPAGSLYRYTLSAFPLKLIPGGRD